MMHYNFPLLRVMHAICARYRAMYAMTRCDYKVCCFKTFTPINVHARIGHGVNAHVFQGWTLASVQFSSIGKD
jgi:hypothetical protein